jgi:hypothetical protein
LSDIHARLQAALADRYVLGRELGRGGMATVYLAQDLKHDRSVALEVLHPEIAAGLGPTASSAKPASPPVCSIPTSSRFSTPVRSMAAPRNTHSMLASIARSIVSTRAAQVLGGDRKLRVSSSSKTPVGGARS